RDSRPEPARVAPARAEVYQTFRVSHGFAPTAPFSAPAGAAGARSRLAGPLTTRPRRSKREPWQGQSQVCSASFQATTHPRCGQLAENSWAAPRSARETATLA